MELDGQPVGDALRVEAVEVDPDGVGVGLIRLDGMRPAGETTRARRAYRLQRHFSSMLGGVEGRGDETYREKTWKTSKYGA